jgi:hypothetical protein
MRLHAPYHYSAVQGAILCQQAAVMAATCAARGCSACEVVGAALCSACLTVDWWWLTTAGLRVLRLLWLPPLSGNTCNNLTDWLTTALVVAVHIKGVSLHVGGGSALHKRSMKQGSSFGNKLR